MSVSVSVFRLPVFLCLLVGACTCVCVWVGGGASNGMACAADVRRRWVPFRPLGGGGLKEPAHSPAAAPPPLLLRLSSPPQPTSERCSGSWSTSCFSAPSVWPLPPPPPLAALPIASLFARQHQASLPMVPRIVAILPLNEHGDILFAPWRPMYDGVASCRNFSRGGAFDHQRKTTLLFTHPHSISYWDHLTFAERCCFLCDNYAGGGGGGS